MNLKSDINLSDFFQAVHTCRGEVLFETPEGDQLNLKSALSQFVFTAAVAGQLRAFRGCLSRDPTDEVLLRPFLRGEEV